MCLIFQEGRSDRKDFVRKRSKLNPHASTSNKEKRKTKNFMMMRHSQNVRTKGKRSFRDRQVTHVRPSCCCSIWLYSCISTKAIWCLCFRSLYEMLSSRGRSSTIRARGDDDGRHNPDLWLCQILFILQWPANYVSSLMYYIQWRNCIDVLCSEINLLYNCVNVSMLIQLWIKIIILFFSRW